MNILFVLTKKHDLSGFHLPTLYVTGLENKLDGANKLIRDQENKLLKLDAANKLLREQSLELEECKTRIRQLEDGVAGLCAPTTPSTGKPAPCPKGMESFSLRTLDSRTMFHSRSLCRFHGRWSGRGSKSRNSRRSWRRRI